MTSDTDASDRQTVLSQVPLALKVATGSLLFLLALVGIRFFLPVGLLPNQTISDHFAIFHDIPVALLYLLCLAIVWQFICGRVQPWTGWWPTGSSSLVLPVSLAVLVLARAGTSIVHLNYGLSVDEYLADFDAAVLRAHSLMAPLDAEWRAYADGLMPMFRTRVADSTHWASAYLPGNAAIRAVFDWLGDRDLASPMLAAASIPIFHGVTRVLFPNDDRTRVVALLLFVVTAQFLITAMTSYAMTAHLLFNLVWLRLFLRDRSWSHGLAAPISFVACGLHQLVFHPLFVAPFILLLLWRKRFLLVAYYGVVFLAIGLFWVSWPSIAAAFEGLPPAQATTLGLPDYLARIARLLAHTGYATSPWWMVENLLRFITWQNPLTWILLILAVLKPRQLTPEAGCLLAGIVLTTAVMLAVLPYQGHGWGYRYLHGLSGNAAMLAAFGWRALTAGNDTAAARATSFFWVGMLMSLVVILPLRLVQVRDFVERHASVHAVIAREPVDVVLLDPIGLWHSEDLVRNDPFLRQRPIVLGLPGLSPGQVMALCQKYRVRLLDRSDSRTASLLRIWPDPTDSPALVQLRAEYAKSCPR